MLHKIFVAFCGLMIAGAMGRSSEAGYGFPPFGAWAYGSGYSVGHGGSYAVGHRGHFHRQHFAHRGYVSHGWRSSYLLGSYGYAYAPYLSYRVRTIGYPAYYRAPIVTVPAYYFAPTYYVPTYYAPTNYFVPTYNFAPTYSTFYGSPLCATPSAPSPSSIQIHSPLPQTVAKPNLASNFLASDKFSVPSSLPLLASVTDTRVPTKMVSASFDQPRSDAVQSLVPTNLLYTADAILMAGGYREAATAYARLNVAYGSSDSIFVRRFVAQLANGDFDQAAVVVASAKAAGYSLNAGDLPGGSLQQLFANDPMKPENISEQLASAAFANSTHPEPMELLGRWLEVSGDWERAALFLQMADKLSADPTMDATETVPTPPASGFVSLR